MSSLPPTMKAVLIERFGGPEVLAYCDVPTPQPGPGDVVVEVRAATVNLTLDIHTRQDGDGRNPMLPLVLGSDPVGVIAAVGSGVDSRRIGEHVAVASTLACATCANCTAGRPFAPDYLGCVALGGGGGTTGGTVGVPSAGMPRMVTDTATKIPSFTAPSTRTTLPT